MPQNLKSVWNSVDLVERLLELSATRSHYTRVRNLFEQPMKDFPEYILLTIAKTTPTAESGASFLMNDLYSILIPPFLMTHENSIYVLDNLWKINDELVIRSICEQYRKDPDNMNLSRVLDITQEIKDTLLPIVTCEDYKFAVHLGILAGKREFLNFDQWLAERI